MKINFQNTITLFPAVKILFLILTGFCIFNNIPDKKTLNAIILLSLPILGVIFLYIGKRTISYIVLSLYIGFWLANYSDDLEIEAPDKLIPETEAIIEGKVEKIITQKSNYLRCIVSGSIDTKEISKIDASGILLSIIKLKENPLALEEGCSIYANVKARLPKCDNISTDFPEKQYAKSLAVQWIARSKAINTAIISPPSFFQSEINRAVRKIKVLCYSLYPKETRGIAAALITGDKTGIPIETKNNFSFAGTAHVLAVSGLHVGIIAASIFVLLGFIPRSWLKFFVFITLLSMFIIISGMQPSAVRAGIMAALILFAKTAQRKINIINILSAAVIILLLLNPGLIYSAGFQMSVASIIGIAFFFNKIRILLEGISDSKNKILNYIRSSIAITISASITVSPIVAYYFEVFSIVSPLTNLFVIPLMTLGLIFALLAIFTSIFSFGIAALYADSSNFLFGLANKINNMAIELPYSYIQGETTVYIAFVISIIIVYMIYSNTLKRFTFRLLSSGFAIVLCLLIFKASEDKEEIEIIPRNQFVASIIPIENNKKFVYIADRKPAQYPFRDFSFEKYLLKQSDTLIFGYGGNAGIALLDEIKKNKEYKTFELPIDIQLKLNELLIGSRALPQIIRY